MCVYDFTWVLTSNECSVSRRHNRPASKEGNWYWHTTLDLRCEQRESECVEEGRTDPGSGKGPLDPDHDQQTNGSTLRTRRTKQWSINQSAWVTQLHGPWWPWNWTHTPFRQSSESRVLQEGPSLLQDDVPRRRQRSLRLVAAANHPLNRSKNVQLFEHAAVNACDSNGPLRRPAELSTIKRLVNHQEPRSNDRSI